MTISLALEPVPNLSTLRKFIPHGGKNNVRRIKHTGRMVNEAAFIFDP
jgi:hypothetical protein